MTKTPETLSQDHAIYEPHFDGFDDADIRVDLDESGTVLEHSMELKKAEPIESEESAQLRIVCVSPLLGQEVYSQVVQQSGSKDEIIQGLKQYVHGQMSDNTYYIAA